MLFTKLSSSVLATTGILVMSVPAFAGPFDAVSKGVFANPGISPGAIGIATPSSTPKAPAAESETIGSGEIEGLGDHESWVSQDVLAEDPRALCSDVGLGNNTLASSRQTTSSHAQSSKNSASSSHKDGGGGGFSFLGIGASGSGSSQGSKNSSNSSNSSARASEASTFESSTVVVGRNCDAFVEAAAARDMNYEDNLTERYRIKVDRRGQQVDNLLQ